MTQDTDTRPQAQPFVFSIRPKYVERILDGHKGWEYRRRRPKLRPDDLILIYETAPCSKIVAVARVGEIRSAHPLDLWASTHDRGCVSTEEFAGYFRERTEAVAIELTRVWALSEPLPLPGGMVAPQAWARLRDGAVSSWRASGFDVSELEDWCS
jgi:predicted transcriptional regulator